MSKLIDKTDILILLTVLLACRAAGCNNQCTVTVGVSKASNVEYAHSSAALPNRLALDIYTPDSASPNNPVPVVVWVHGGAWYRGDKSVGTCDKINFFVGLGYVLVSVNYRLSPDPPELQNPDRIMFPVHAEDVAAAVAYIREHISTYGGDPGRIALFGHSAGAHLVALISTDESYLASHGYGLDIIRCVGSLDVDAYDIPAAMQSLTGELRDVFLNAFGDNAQVWEQASPINYVEAGKGIPPFLLVSRGDSSWKSIEEEFAAALDSAGVDETMIKADLYTHVQIDTMIGAPQDDTLTPAIERFLKNRCF